MCTYDLECLQVLSVSAGVPDVNPSSPKLFSCIIDPLEAIVDR